ncbi:MAG: DUF4465 domain-containing protein [Alistipes sp.]|nr:DUF4465 domain-containing protein [Alistipes sp.]
MKGLVKCLMCVALLAQVACKKDDAPKVEMQEGVATFENWEFDSFVAERVGSSYSSDVVTADYVWCDDFTMLTSRPVTAEWDGVSYLSSGFAVSSYCTNQIEELNDYGGYLKDLYVYHEKYKYGIMNGGNKGSNRFLVGYGNYEGTDFGAEDDYRPTIEFFNGETRTIKGCYVNSTAYFVAITKLGNEFSPALGDGDVIKLYATGYDASGTETATAEMVLAEKGNIITKWTYWDLSALGEVAKVRFNIKGGPTDEWGMTSPKYFALDDITVTWPKPQTE